MAETIALSRSARSLLKCLLAGEPPGTTPGKPEGYRELMAAGFVERVAVEDDGVPQYRLTRNGQARRREFLPHPHGPSAAARTLLKRLVAGESVGVSDTTRSAYRELAAAGLMDPLHTFAGGDESAYRFTEQGWERRFEFIGPSPGGFSARLRRWAALFLGLLSAPRRVNPFRARPTRAR
jgi:hypothetical protein